MKHTTRILIAVPSRVDGSRKDKVNMLALVLPQGATLVSGPALLVSNQGSGAWGPLGQFPNIFEHPLNRTTESDGLQVVGRFINNRDERLVRCVEATFIWDGEGPDMAETSVENFTGWSTQEGEAVWVAFSVPNATAPVLIKETYQDGVGTAPFGAALPPNLTIKRGVPLDFPPGYMALGQTLKILNGDGVAHRVIRLTASIGI